LRRRRKSITALLAPSPLLLSRTSPGTISDCRPSVMVGSAVDVHDPVVNPSPWRLPGISVNSVIPTSLLGFSWTASFVGGTVTAIRQRAPHDELIWAGRAAKQPILFQGNFRVMALGPCGKRGGFRPTIHLILTPVTTWPVIPMRLRHCRPWEITAPPRLSIHVNEDVAHNGHRWFKSLPNAPNEGVRERWVWDANTLPQQLVLTFTLRWEPRFRHGLMPAAWGKFQAGRCPASAPRGCYKRCVGRWTY